MARSALICGVSGQDGAYLAQLLLDAGYTVWGTSRDAQVSSFVNLVRLGIRDRVHLTSMAVNDFRSVLLAIDEARPDEIYNLAGQSSVGLSFQQPMETLESIVNGTLNLLEAIRFTGAPIRFYNAGSGECFGDTGGRCADETTPFHPRSPYAVAKAAAHWAVVNYREAYDLFACNGILFNHESPLRPDRFVTRKIVRGACRIAAGGDAKVALGNLDIHRDWGWAPDYVDAMHRMLQQDTAEDYVIATGVAHSLREFTGKVFEALGLDPVVHLLEDPSLYRPAEIAYGCGNPALAAERLDWRPRVDLDGVIERMIAAET